MGPRTELSRMAETKDVTSSPVDARPPLPADCCTARRRPVRHLVKVPVCALALRDIRSGERRAIETYPAGLLLMHSARPDGRQIFFSQGSPAASVMPAISDLPPRSGVGGALDLAWRGLFFCLRFPASRSLGAFERRRFGATKPPQYS